MTAYISSILGAVLLGVVIEVVMPNGDMQKYIRGMYSIFVIFILMTPIANLLKADFDVNKYFTTEAVVISDDYIEYITRTRAESMSTYLESKLADDGLKGVDIEVAYLVNDYEISLDKILVNLDKLVIIAQDEHINKYDIIINGITKYVNVEEDKIVFNE